MSIIIDKRATAHGTSSVNRDRFIRRYKRLIEEQVERAVSRRSLKDIEGGADIVIRRNDVTEPELRHARGSGDDERVLPGNDRFTRGDHIPKPRGGGAGGDDPGREAGDEAADDSFTFALSKEEFMSLFFDQLQLPNLARTQLARLTEMRQRRAGFIRYGSPGHLSVSRTMKTALARRIAMAGAFDQRIEALTQALDAQLPPPTNEVVEPLYAQLDQLRRLRGALPFLDDVDLRYRGTVLRAEPKTAAVMFCLMDVSGSMNEKRKDLAKRFFALLYLFLKRKYEQVDVVFIRHTTTAEECDEETFFYDPQSGGTEVLPALELMSRIIAARYPASAWNIYGAQCSDGDSFGNDPAMSGRFLERTLLPLTRYFVYVEVGEPTSRVSTTLLWEAYRQIGNPLFKQARVLARNQIYPALAQLFAKEAAAA